MISLLTYLTEAVITGRGIEITLVVIVGVMVYRITRALDTFTTRDREVRRVLFEVGHAEQTPGGLISTYRHERK